MLLCRSHPTIQNINISTLYHLTWMSRLEKRIRSIERELTKDGLKLVNSLKDIKEKYYRLKREIETLEDAKRVKEKELQRLLKEVIK